jgi:hypothetical protein
MGISFRSGRVLSHQPCLSVRSPNMSKKCGLRWAGDATHFQCRECVDGVLSLQLSYVVPHRSGREAAPAAVEEVKWRKPTNPKEVPVWSHGGIICTGGKLKDP